MKYLSLVINHDILKKASFHKKINLKKHSQSLLIKQLLIENIGVLVDKPKKFSKEDMFVGRIDFTDFGLKEKNVKIFLQSMHYSKEDFVYFDLSGNNVINKAMLALSDYLFFNHKVETLILRSIPMQSHDIREICKALVYNRSIKRFHLSGDNFVSSKEQDKLRIRVENTSHLGIENIVKSPYLEEIYLHSLSIVDSEEFMKIFEKMSTFIFDRFISTKDQEKEYSEEEENNHDKNKEKSRAGR